MSLCCLLQFVRTQKCNNEIFLLVIFLRRKKSAVKTTAIVALCDEAVFLVLSRSSKAAAAADRARAAAAELLLWRFEHLREAGCILHSNSSPRCSRTLITVSYCRDILLRFSSVVTPCGTPPITRIQMSEAPAAAATPSPCRSWARSDKCHYGSICRFLHQLPASPGSAAQSLHAPAAVSPASSAQRLSKKRKASHAFILDTAGDTSLLSVSGLVCSCEVECGNTEATGPPLKKNSGDVVSVKSWPTNKSWVVRLFKFENVELDARCLQRTSLLALAALAGVNSQATSVILPR